MKSRATVIVIGGGISGLACAYRLKSQGFAVRLLEATEHGGGVISTVSEKGFRFELGPQSFLATECLLALIRELGLEGDLLRADSRAPRYILLRGKLVPVPLAPPSLLTTPLLNATTKWRLLTEMFRHTQPPAEDESIAAFVRRKFGAELLDHMVAPMVSGIHAGDPERLSLRAAFPKVHEFESRYGSVLRGAIKSRPPKPPKDSPRPARPGLCSFREGIATLPRALAAQLGETMICGSRVTAVRRACSDGEPGFALEVARNSAPDAPHESIAARSVVIACPTNTAAEILAPISTEFAACFSPIEYAPVAVVATGYRREQIPRPLRGFGFLVPRREGLRLLGTVWNSSLFPGCAPEGMVALTSFAGGATDPGLCALGEDEIGGVVTAELARVLQISGQPVARIVRRIPRALPQYNLGHTKTIAALRALAASVPGLFLTGNYLEGPSLGACVEQANHSAGAVAAQLAPAGTAARVAE